MQKVTNGAIIKAKDGWICCPACGKRVFKITEKTRAENLPLYCRHCKKTNIVNIESLSL